MDIGPILSKPGPMLLKQETAAEKLVVNPNGSKLSTKKIRIIDIM